MYVLSPLTPMSTLLTIHWRARSQRHTTQETAECADVSGALASDVDFRRLTQVLTGMERRRTGTG